MTGPSCTWCGSPVEPDDVFLEILDHGVTDRVRAAIGFPRHALHARAIAFPHPKTGQILRIRTGTIVVNGGSYYGADVPFGGYKQSGIGREMGVLGFEASQIRRRISGEFSPMPAVKTSPSTPPRTAASAPISLVAR